MWRYLKAAFFARPTLPGLGAFPVNVVAVIAVGILGFAHPGAWLLGIGLETAYLATLATNRRFQRLVDATDSHEQTFTAEQQHQRLVAQLQPEPRARLARLESRCEQAASLQRDLDADAITAGSNDDALRRLRWLYLKLLLAGQYLRSREIHADESALRKQVSSIESELRAATLPASLRTSKTATLDILHRRLQNLQQREQSLREVDSDLQRIEAQVDLVVENAATRGGQPQAVSSNIELATQMLDLELYGASASAVNDLDAAFAPRVPA